MDLLLCSLLNIISEFDKQKSKVKNEKFGINFIEAQHIWEDPDCVMIPARTFGESRFLYIGVNLQKQSRPEIG
jgi:uncharacterized DUF497 family protein